MLSEHGLARLQVSSPPAKSVAIMLVLRAELGIGLMDAKAVLRRVLDGDCSGTLPEMERLARRLRESGIAATATRPQGPSPELPQQPVEFPRRDVPGRRSGT
ncbi:hypothetical protein [Streptomyces sp. NPDC127066]|uniref:hypothetical protein n=1 Tax=Streptomyces sp. NPDC127066 TaxID=3347125 RepID=UPI0036611AB2